VPTIPLRELRNDVSRVVRRAERGERFTITVNGRPVASLGPLAERRPAAEAARLGEIILAAPVDRGWPAELARLRAEDLGESREPWRG
jgi:prevent-host-death family protein